MSTQLSDYTNQIADFQQRQIAQTALGRKKQEDENVQVPQHVDTVADRTLPSQQSRDLR